MLPSDLHLPASRTPFTYSKRLLVEGKDAFQFFKALLRHLSLLTQIEIRNAGGIDEFTDYLETLPVVSGFSTVISLGIVRDAEDQDVHSAFQSVRNGLHRANLSVPERLVTAAYGNPRVSVFILPDCSKTGTLESLCLDAVTDQPASLCVKQYFQCLQEQGVDLPRNRPKSQLQAFLASKLEFVAHLGEAAHKGYFPWDSPVFKQLKQFLCAL